MGVLPGKQRPEDLTACLRHAEGPRAKPPLATAKRAVAADAQ
jgi:hypothetical protein